MPNVSIIIRTLNEEKYLGSLLQKIREQTYTDYEIILVDSGSTDRTLEIARPVCDHILTIEKRDFTFGHSLNTGCRQAQGNFLVIISAHALPVNEFWLQKLVDPLKDEDVAMVYGRQIGADTTKFSEKQDFERHYGALQTSRHPLPYFTNNANSILRTSLWQKLPFNEYITGLEDIVWAKQVIEKGWRIEYAAESTVHHIHEESWTQVYNRYRREALASRATNLPHPPLGSPHVIEFIKNVMRDLLKTFPHYSFHRIRDILMFRYKQWRGTKQGWYRAKDIDVKEEHDALFYSTQTNQRVVISHKEKAALVTQQLPELKPSEVLIQTSFVGVCTTDLEIFKKTLGYYKEGRARYPIVPGHEFSGTIARIGANVKNFHTGDRVVGECILSCHNCVHCAKGSYVACEKRTEVGVLNKDGAYAQYVVLPSHHIHTIPDSISLKEACLAEPLAVALKGLRKLRAMLPDLQKIAVIGAGPIGNLLAQAAQSKGINVTVFDRSRDRLQFLPENINKENDLHAIDTFDCIVEATGDQNALTEILKKSKANATILLLGFPYGDIHYNFEEIVAQEKNIIGSVGSTGHDFEGALKLLPRLELTPFFEMIFPLHKFQEAWKRHLACRHLKVLLEVQGEN